MASQTTLSVKIGLATPPASCSVSRGDLGVLTMYRNAANVSTFSAIETGDSSWGPKGESGKPTIVYLDVLALSAQIKVGPKAYASPVRESPRSASTVPGTPVVGESGDVAAMVGATGLPVLSVGGSTKAGWLGVGFSSVKLYPRDASNALLTMKSEHHFNGSEIEINNIESGRYALVVTPSFQFSAADVAEAARWHRLNKGKHWPFSVTCTAQAE